MLRWWHALRAWLANQEAQCPSCQRYVMSPEFGKFCSRECIADDAW